MRRFTLLMIGFVVALTGTSAEANPIGLTMPAVPDIIAGFIDVTYDATADQFNAMGFSLNFNGSNLDVLGVFDLSATIDDAGALGTGGTLSIGGEIGTNTSPLLEGGLTDFGFNPAGGNPFEFLFEVTGGSLASDFGGIGAQGGIILSSLTTFPGTFLSDFDNLNSGTPGTGTGFADVGSVMVPLPGAVVLGVFGLGIVGVVRRKIA